MKSVKEQRVDGSSNLIFIFRKVYSSRRETGFWEKYIYHNLNTLSLNFHTIQNNLIKTQVRSLYYKSGIDP